MFGDSSGFVLKIGVLSLKLLPKITFSYIIFLFFEFFICRYDALLLSYCCIKEIVSLLECDEMLQLTERDITKRTK